MFDKSQNISYVLKMLTYYFKNIRAFQKLHDFLKIIFSIEEIFRNLSKNFQLGCYLVHRRIFS